MENKTLLQVHDIVPAICRNILGLPKGCKAFVPNIDASTNMVDELLDAGFCVTGFSDNEKQIDVFNSQAGQRFVAKKVADRRIYKLSESFHFAYCVPEFQHDTFAKNPDNKWSVDTITDAMMQWKCSEGHADRIADTLRIDLEQCMNAVYAGGFFAAVLPKNFMGRDMRWMKWWERQASPVARIRLPVDPKDRHRAVERAIIERRMNSFGSYRSYDTEHRNSGGVDELTLATIDEFAPKRIVDWTRFECEWELHIWFRLFNKNQCKETAPRSFEQQIYLDWAEFTADQFSYTMEKFTKTEIKRLLKSFRQSEWHKMSVRGLRQMLKRYSSNRLFGTTQDWATPLPDEKDFFLFKPKEENRAAIYVIPDEDFDKVFRLGPDGETEGRKMLGIHVKPTRSGIKLCVPDDKYTKEGKCLYSVNKYAKQALLHEVMLAKGVELDKTTGEYDYLMERDVLSRPLSTVREELIATLIDAGLTPYITASDEYRVRKHERWLNIQLCPIPRNIPVKVVDINDEDLAEEGDTGDDHDLDFSGFDGFLKKEDLAEEEEAKTKQKDEDELRKKEYAESESSVVVTDSRDQSKVWEKIYTEMSVKAVFPEVWDMWVKRAKKIKLDKKSMKHQWSNILEEVIHHGTLAGDVMGLGKTFQVLATFVLSGCKRMLIVCPSRLIGTWQDEVETLINPWLRRIRRNWTGERFEIAAPNVITHVRDTFEENLKMFNIVSYDRLKMTPPDSRFYKCPECEAVVWSPGDHPQKCPGQKHLWHPDPLQDESCQGPLRRWRWVCRLVDEETGKLKYRKHKVHLPTGKVVHWDSDHISRRNIPESECKVKDPRVTIIQNGGFEYEGKFYTVKLEHQDMNRQDTMFKKMNRIQVGTEVVKETDPFGDVIETKVPKFKYEERKPHFRWTLASILREKFPFVAADEILNVSNADSQRAQVFAQLRGKRRIGATGTPMKGKPQDVVPYLNWIAKRDVFPDYRPHDGGTKRFLDEYATYATVASMDGASGSKRQIARANNPSRFQADLCHLMARHVRDEPEVLENIPRIPQIAFEERVDMDDKHRAYYKKVQEIFEEWWEMMKEESEGKSVNGNQIVVKLMYLRNASANPHFMLKELVKKDEARKKGKGKGKSMTKADEHFYNCLRLLGQYRGPFTAKQLRTQDIIRKAVKSGDKVIAFSTRNDVLDLMQDWSTKVSLNSMVIDGRTPLAIDKATNRSKRHEMVQEWRQQNYHVMWGGIMALNEGMNIPEANHGIIMDYEWTPAVQMQAIGRMIRPQQKKTVNSYFLMHKGTIDEFMVALCYLKGRSSDESIDYVEFDDFGAALIPDAQQYANAIVDGTEEVMKRNMWLQVEHVKKQIQQRGEDLNEES